LMYRLAAGHIRTLRVRGEALVEEELLIVRTHSSLWCATLGEEVMLLTVTVRELADMIYKICEGIDEPRDQEIPAQDPLGKTRGATSPDGSWRCACGRSNMGNYCAGCGKPQPKAAQGSPPASEDKSWRCACGRTNTGNFCDGCGAKRP
ncbi:MAG TPA: hypothetical protein PK071_04155, partial [Atopobiaceae bacterium]|nr:hypothetical protein [Atopobiaceae bacterium]